MGLSNPGEEKAYSISEHSVNALYPSCLVAKKIKGELDQSLLHPKQVLILHLGQQQYIWKVHLDSNMVFLC